MRTDEFSNICLTAKSGKEAWVQNLDLLYSGRVVNCHEHIITVETFGSRHDWEADHCRPVDCGTDPLGPPTNI